MHLAQMLPLTFRGKRIRLIKMTTLKKAWVNNLINLISFQGVWFATILGAANENLWYGLVALSCFVLLHHFLSATAKTDFRLATLAILLGMIVETGFIQTGILSYTYSIPSTQFAPIWILILWANLALTLNGCLRWLHGRYLLAALLGAIGGPLTYFGGIKLGAATTDLPMSISLGSIAVIYAFTTPLLLLLARRFSRGSEAL
jgi:hypothetical protein